MNRRDFSARLAGTSLGALGTSILAVPTFAQGVPVEGKHYVKIDPPVPPTQPGKVEVIEFFSYACPHCNAFEPTIAAWSKKLPPDVAFHRVPVPFLMNAENLMRTYYALETMGQVELMQAKVFAAIHVERNYLEKPADIAALMAKNGIDAAKFSSVFNSFSVASSVTRAKKLTAQYRVDSVPTLAVQGRWSTSPAQAGGLEQATAAADYLIQRSRAKA
ncbi:MAG TPA: thiol:disulfide interchange protein DsbA/DsbL [Burkholderiaceae bacterium]|nr:thiol:disulfide interchange protein DsbA/DsbL [Burkholderiaceae bacterium]